MRKFKKFLCAVLASTMVLAMAAPSFAENGNASAPNNSGKITITNSIENQQYTIYKLFDLESYDTDKKAYSYKLAPNSPWRDFFTGTGAGAAYVSIDSQDYVTWVAADKNNDSNTAHAFAQAALAYAKAHTTTISPVNVTAKAGEKVGDRIQLTYEGLELGYYLVDSSVGALCGLTTTDPTKDITEKNADVPTVDKTIDGTNGNNSSSASIGDKINYTVTIHAKKGAENYVLSDTMTTGLTFNNDVTIKVNGNELDVKENQNDTEYDYEVKTTGVGNHTFEVVFNNTYLSKITDDTDIVVTYSATLNSNAIIEGDNKNSANLSYGNSTETVTSETNTKTWKFDVSKFALINNTRTALSGATFTLSTDEEGENIINLVKKDNGEVYQVCTLSDEEHTSLGISHTHVTSGEITTTLENGANGKFEIEGLKSGTYYLNEINAPNGYNTLESAVEVIIADGKTTYIANATAPEAEGTIIVKALDPVTKDMVNTVAANKNVDIENKAGSVLPSTGGIGTTIFYAVGIILMAGAVFFVVRRKRA